MNRIHIRPAARQELRAIEQPQALSILRAVASYLSTGMGDVEKLEGVENQFRLRVGDYRVIFRREPDSINILHVRHRREAYR